MRARGAVRVRRGCPRAQVSAGGVASVSHEYVRCAMCGHDFPVELVRRRGWVECGCGMRIQIQAAHARRAAPSALALLLFAAAIVLLTAVAALARRLATG